MDKEQQRRYLDEPRLKELTEVMKQTRVLVRKKGVPEAVGTGQAVQEVGGCDYPSLLPVVSLVPVPDTGKNGGNGQVGTDGGIERYLFHGEERFPAYGYQT